MHSLIPDGDGTAAAKVTLPSGLTECFLVSETGLNNERNNMPATRSSGFSRRWPAPESLALKTSRSTSRTADTSPAPTIPSPVSLRSLVLDEDSIQDMPAGLRDGSTDASASTISSVSSRRHSLAASAHEDGGVASVPAAAGPSDRAPDHHQHPSSSVNSQFIMPSVRISPPPTFTENGRAIGKLKVLVAGRPGIGKTSLVQSITQLCEDIIHVDTGSSSRCPCEVLASTRPHPGRWQSSSVTGGTVSRRYSATRATAKILDRNICFVDVPSTPSSCQHPSSVSGYLHTQTEAVLRKRLDDTDLWSLLANGAYPIVDVVLYMLPHEGPWDQDIETIRQIQGLTNVIPLIARADELSDDASEQVQKQIAESLSSENVQPFSFDDDAQTAEVFAVSSAPTCDLDTMDASELMDPAYKPPLVRSSLQRLVGRLFSPDGSASLRNAVALKLVWWRRTQAEQDMALQLSSSRLPSVWPVHLYSWVQFDASLDSAKWWRHIDLSDWAKCLRRSIADEGTSPPTIRELEVIAGQDFHNLSLMRCGRDKSDCKNERPDPSRDQDPLGLLLVVSRLRRERRRTIEVLGGLGIAALATVCLIQT